MREHRAGIIKIMQRTLEMSEAPLWVPRRRSSLYLYVIQIECFCQLVKKKPPDICRAASRESFFLNVQSA
jgi:hypothetical protein